MIRAALRLLALYFLAWLLSTQWDGANTLYREALNTALTLGPQQNSLWTVASFFGVALLWQLLGLGLWVVCVPVDNRLGPKLHPFPDRPLRVQLRFRPSRLMGGFAATMFGLLLSLRALEALVPTPTQLPPQWLRPKDDGDVWLTYLAVHLLTVAIAWLALAALCKAHVPPNQSHPHKPRSHGFIAYHLEHKPLWRLFNRIVLFAHFPLAAFAATSHPHHLHLLVVCASLLALLCVAVLAQSLVLLIERRHQRWLVSLEGEAATQMARGQAFVPAYDTWARTLHFLHPNLDPLPAPALPTESAQSPQPPPESATQRANAEPKPKTGPEPEDLEPGSAQTATPQEAVQPDPEPWETAPRVDEQGAYRVLMEGIVSLERQDYRRARALLKDATVIGDHATRERAEALLKTIPGSRTRIILATGVVTIPVLALALFISWEWFSLPSGEETRRLARSAHIHVRKTSTSASATVGLLGTRYDYSLNTRLENISPHFVKAVIASEDHRYFEHGVSYKIAKFAQAGVLCILRKLNPIAATRACKGNSTLPQQLARNLFLSEKRSIRRKLTELLWAIKMEASLSKEEVLELYMNRIYLGKGNFGVEMAARSYFQKSAADLRLLEAVYLAAAIKRPNWNWHQDRKGALKRAQLILALMQRHGVAGANTKLPSNFTPRLGYRNLHKPYLGHLWQWIRPAVQTVIEDLPDGDYKILTSLNAEVEVYAERHLQDAILKLRNKGIIATQGAVVAMRPNGEVLAMVGGVGDGVKARGFNRAKRTRGMHSRPPASSFKPFVYLAALEQGLTPDSRIDARPVAISIPGASEPYRPQNHDGKEHGYITMREGLVHSVNTAAVRLLHDRLGFERLLNTVGRLGIDASDFRQQWGLALGQSAVPLIEMVGAYGVFASGGKVVEPHAVLAITTDNGRTVWRRKSPSPKQAFSRTAIAQLNDMLTQVVRTGTGHRAKSGLPPETVVAGKTGTGDDFVDAWFLGFTNEIVIGVWIGNDRPTSMPGVFGGTTPAQVFNEILRDLIAYTSVLDAEEI